MKNFLAISSGLFILAYIFLGYGLTILGLGLLISESCNYLIFISLTSPVIGSYTWNIITGSGAFFSY